MNRKVKIKMFLNFGVGIWIIVALNSAVAVERRVLRVKRQIYREQVLPEFGGKIPESAFETDRLLLNRLQKEGIAIPDGVILQPRYPRVYNTITGEFH